MAKRCMSNRCKNNANVRMKIKGLKGSLHYCWEDMETIDWGATFEFGNRITLSFIEGSEDMPDSYGFAMPACDCESCRKGGED